MEIISVGQDDLDEWDIKELPAKDLTHFVYWYEIGDYCGDGNGVAIYPDKTLDVLGFGHCSCNGPINGYHPDRSRISLAALTKIYDPESALTDAKDSKLLAKVTEILTAHTLANDYAI